MKRRPRVALIEDPDALRALSSTVRLDIVDMVQALGEASASDIALQLGRGANTLHYHLRALTQAGLLRKAGERRRERHVEAVYSTQDPRARLAISHHALRRGSSRALRGIVASMLASARREYLAASGLPGLLAEGPERELWPCRAVGWLSVGRLRRVNRLLHELTRLMSSRRRDADDRLFALQFLLAPIVGKETAARAPAQPKPRRARRSARAETSR